MAASPASTVIDDLQNQVEDAHLASEYLAANVLDTLSHLQAAIDEAANRGWDGYGAKPADPAAYHYARRLATLLGSAHQPTEVSVDPDGEVSLDWDHGPDAVVSVSVSGRGRLAYAARVGPNRSRGVERLSDEVPEQVVTLIRRVATRGA